MKLWQFLVEYYNFSSQDEVEMKLKNTINVLVNGTVANDSDYIMKDRDVVSVSIRYRTGM